MVLRSSFSKISANTNYNERDIQNLKRNTVLSIKNLITYTYGKNGIDRENYDDILRFFENYIVSSLSRAERGWTKKMDSSTHKYAEVITQNANPQQERKKTFGVI